MFDKAKDMYQLQKQAKQIKKELRNTHIEAEVDGVIVTINGEQEVISVQLPESIENPKKLSDILVKAFNKGVKRSQQIAADMMKDVMGGLNLPGSA
ncbi:YbaB/EbfC family nucleoid-associated protein [Pseudomonadota bacterium]